MPGRVLSIKFRARDFSLSTFVRIREHWRATICCRLRETPHPVCRIPVKSNVCGEEVYTATADKFSAKMAKRTKTKRKVSDDICNYVPQFQAINLQETDTMIATIDDPTTQEIWYFINVLRTISKNFPVICALLKQLCLQTLYVLNSIEAYKYVRNCTNENIIGAQLS